MPGILLSGEEFDSADHPAIIDRSHPFFDGVSAAIINIGPHPRWLRNEGFGVGSPTLNGAFATSANDVGIAARFDGSSTYLDYGVLNIADEFTLLMGITFDALSGVTGLIDASNGSTNGWSLFTSGTDMYLSGNHYSGDLLSSGWATGKFYHLAARNKLGVGKAVFRNGVMIASDPSSLIGVSNPTNPLWLGRLRVSGPQYISARVAYGYLVDKYLPDAAIAAIAENPSQIVMQEGNFVWVPGGGGTGPGTAYTLEAAPAAFSLSPQAATLRATRKLIAGSSAMVLTGYPATLRATRKLIPVSASYNVSGVDVAFRATRKLAAASRAFNLTTIPANLARGYVFNAATCTYTNTTYAAMLRATRRLVCGTGAFHMTPRDAIIVYSAAPIGSSHNGFYPWLRRRRR